MRRSQKPKSRTLVQRKLQKLRSWWLSRGNQRVAEGLTVNPKLQPLFLSPKASITTAWARKTGDGFRIHSVSGEDQECQGFSTTTFR